MPIPERLKPTFASSLPSSQLQNDPMEEARRRLSEAARWAADRTPMDAELRLVEQLLARQKRTSAQTWRTAAPYYPDSSALATTARA